jgi:type I restriction enzyme, S subunit
MTCVGSFGVICINPINCVINQQLHAFIMHSKILSKYFAYALKSKFFWMEKNSTATTVSYLNKTNCNSIPIPVCSLSEQNQIVDEIESRLSICDRLKAETKTTSKS